MEEVPVKDQILKYKKSDGYEFVIGTGEPSFRGGWTIILDSSHTRKEAALGRLTPADIFQVIGFANWTVERAGAEAALARRQVDW